MQTIRTVKDYKVQQQLGEGRFSTVFQGQELRTGQSFAIKILKNGGYTEYTYNQEVAILKHLQQSHADRYNIVKYLGSYWKPEEAGLFFEMLDMTLGQYMQRVENRLSLQNISSVIRQVATALDALQRLNVIHTDVTPKSIMLVGELRQPFKVKLTDFGSALWIDRFKCCYPVQSPPFRSPEILLGHSFNEAIDMWSLGCVTARMFVGFNLFPGTSDYEVMHFIVDLLGKPPCRFLCMRLSTLQYFQFERRCLIPHWRLKTPTEYVWQTNTTFVDSRDYRFTSLDVLKVEATDGQISPEDDDKNACVELIERMLDLRPKKRIKPKEVIAHPFITRSFSDTHSAAPRSDNPE